MKTVSFLMLLLFVQYKSTGQGSLIKGCRDSSIRVAYKINAPVNNYGGLLSLVLKDTSLLNVSGYIDNSGTHAVVTKFGSRYNVLWSHAFSLPGKQYLIIYNCKELSTGEILIAGYTGTNQNLPNDTALSYYFALLDTDGNLIWQFLMDPDPKPANRPLYTMAIEENAGEIYLLLNDYTTKIFNMHHDGSPGWCKSFFKSNAGSGAASGLFINGNELNVILNNQNPNEVQCGSNATQRMLTMKMDKFTGNVRYQKNYCYPVTVNNFEDRPYLAIQLANKQYAVTMVNSIQSSGQNFTVFYFDTGLVPVKTIGIKNNNVAQVGNGNNISINKNGKILLSWLEIDVNSSNSFAPKLSYAVIDTNKNFLLQRKINARGDQNYVGSPGAHVSPFLFSRNVLQTEYMLQGKYYFDYFDLSDSIETNDNCLGYDSSVFNIQDISPSESNWVWDSVVTGQFAQYAVNATLSPFSYTKAEICKKLVVCDTLKITGEDTVCLDNTLYIYKVHRNVSCDKKMLIGVDSNYCKIIQNSGDTILQVQFKKPGKIRLYASIENCVLSDSFLIVCIQPKKNFSINKDSLLCPGSQIALVANEGFSSYTWQDGSHLNIFSVTDTGLYKVQAIDSCGNYFSDSVHVALFDSALSLNASTTICSMDTVMLNVPLKFTSATWQPSTGAAYVPGKLKLFPSQTTLYNISFNSKEGCAVDKAVTVIINNCVSNIFFPNSFSPNGNSRNDYFKPLVTATLQAYHLVIFNRLGERVFETYNPQVGWDGSFNKVAQNSGVFVYYCLYKFPGKPGISKKGYCILVR